MAWHYESLILSAFSLLLGGGLGFAGYYSLKKTPSAIVFDEFKKIYYRGNLEEARASTESNSYGTFADVYSIQLLDKQIRTSTENGDNSIAYTCYELILVLKNGNRLNIMNHAVRDEIVKSSNKLAELLNIPIWQASV